MSIKRKIIEIRKPYYGAGSEKSFGWVKDGFDIWGIGVKVEYVTGYDSLDIKLDGKIYRVSTVKIKEFVARYNSYYNIDNYGVQLAVFSKSILRNIISQKKEDRVINYY
jgi:hypothetical protein